ncbi:hypothetical protein DdX_20259 [Ditylenchus destructor]|uniref:Auto-transporter adhesin head GIN domain-containing protein n=1 Tax=Ditylenchus destructor TaxID=166010 RepID=A0AAD4MIC2_9BILA|nr:hypothetical protein DdX_20259 [Ditylenchus destructor]
MNALSSSLAIFILFSSSHAAPNRARRFDFDERTDALENFWLSMPQRDPYRYDLLHSDSATISTDDVVFTISREVASAGNEATVNRIVSSGNLTLAAENNAVVIAGFNSSTVAVTADNATLVIGGQNSNFSVTLSINSKVSEAFFHSSGQITVIDSECLLFAEHSYVHVTAINSTLLIANVSSTLIVRLNKGSTATYAESGIFD